MAQPTQLSWITVLKTITIMLLVLLLSLLSFGAMTIKISSSEETVIYSHGIDLTGDSQQSDSELLNLLKYKIIHSENDQNERKTPNIEDIFLALENKNAKYGHLINI